jgi:hypothetical protein
MSIIGVPSEIMMDPGVKLCRRLDDRSFSGLKSMANFGDAVMGRAQEIE